MCFVFSVRNIIVWGQRGHKEAAVRGVVTPLVIYSSPAVEVNPTTFTFCVCTAVVAVWLYDGGVGRVVRKHVLGDDPPRGG